MSSPPALTTRIGVDVTDCPLAWLAEQVAQGNTLQHAGDTQLLYHDATAAAWNKVYVQVNAAEDRVQSPCGDGMRPFMCIVKARPSSSAKSCLEKRSNELCEMIRPQSRTLYRVCDGEPLPPFVPP